jgi:hypothetical protein
VHQFVIPAKSLPSRKRGAGIQAGFRLSLRWAGMTQGFYRLLSAQPQRNTKRISVG